MKLIWNPGTLARDLNAEDGITKVLANPGQPPAREATFDHFLVMGLTPTATTVTVGVDGPAEVVGADLNTFAQGGISSIGALRHLRVWARRKAGSTGTIAAQTIIFGGTDGPAMVEMGRIKVAAAAAGADPVSDVFDQSFHAGHANFSNGLVGVFMLNLTAADPDLEIVLEIYGNA